MIICKINQVPNTKELLRQRVSRPWRINMSRLYNQKHLAVLYKEEVLEVYEVISYDKDDEQPKKVKFELKEIEHKLKGKKLNYKTSNPCTIKEE